ncbi:ABC transporter substrate-binding protein [Phytoactinopolyspora mesophila]|uniref:ABC transporter substrate-binding protein n=1 Tax=Phytoactinopolyspora mesophila TaxID=2650750 RepID=A0A7K3M8I1_9ACTN|nr:ABC transporter substrate-binding protein [Phytoactinopolyspora mesophila]NDL59297.1 ABC transporter substrate-binding protein [Phytoactinopolyspora mesophila]
MTTTTNMRRPMRLAAVTVALALPASAVAAPAAQAADDESHTLIVGTSGLDNIPHMNPLDSGWLIQGELNNLMYDPLIRWSQDDYSPSPGLATDWEVSDDELTWTYYMNPDATWSDGEPITAHDAAFTFNLLIENPVFNGRHGELVNNFTSVEATDDHTLVIEIEEPSALMAHLNGVSIMIMPEHVWGDIENPDEYHGEPGQPTSGAFELAEWREGEQVRLTAVEDYWAGPVAYDEFILQNFQTPEAMVQALQAGEVDLIGGLNPQQYEALEAADHITTSTGPGRRLQSLNFNTGAQTQDGEEIGDGHPALRDPAVRQAIHHVIDKEQLIQVAMDGHAIAGVSLVPPIFSDYYWEPGDELVEVSADIGNQILDDAGYDERDENGVRIDPESGESLVFRLHYHSDRPTYAIIKDFIVDWVAELDIVLEDIAMDTTPLNEEGDAGRYDIEFGTWNPGPEATGTLVYHTCDRLPAEPEPTDLTFAFYCNEEYDALFEAQLAESDLEARSEILREMQQLLYLEAPSIQMYYENQLEAYNSDRWGNFGTQPSAGGMIREQQGAFGYEAALPAGAADEAGGDDDGAAGDEGDTEAAAADDDGAGATPWIIAAVVILVVAAAVVLLMRRRSAADNRE